MKLILILILIIINIFISTLFIACNNSNSSNNNYGAYSGPASCVNNKSLTLDETIVGGNQVTNNNTTLTGNNTVAIILNNQNNTKTIECTGTIVASNLILTAGHCFDEVGSSNTSPGWVIFADTYDSFNINNSASISCWQRPGGYIPCSVSDTYNCILNDITWVKINGNISRFNNYVTTSILANPQTISARESKWMLGFGKLSDNPPSRNSNKYMVQSSSSNTYPDTLPSGAARAFDSYTFSNAYENYLTVIGPNTTPPKGTCEGDSGGPVYVLRNGNYVLAALTQGSNSLLTPKPTNTSPTYTFDYTKYASCDDGYGVYTTVGNYISWIQSSSGVTLSTY
ncbi:trypsin-like serine protease [Silvanigrella aquatica]|uniref:Peptidase S1 domain-containing protein n=1 Tax=Silvanigrella aquatica TaxID=1915309 RepID=A0A1L4D279_9BACT|nr:trypsin-like serine protease [Silvanigrella aquatica]APJ04309.1 hypothetical protein AXG55_10485 [Silvanigrella aquatica]